MDRQGIGFEKLGPGADCSLEWLQPIESVRKIDFKLMCENVNSGLWTLWRLGGDAEGLAVTYPYHGALFIYYLHGRGLFDTLKSEDLLLVAKSENLNGVKAETTNPATLRLLRRVGFEVYATGPTGWCVELTDGCE